MQRFHRDSVRLLSALLVVIGVAMAVAAVAQGGGALSRGVVLGVLFALLGAGRLALSRPPRERA